MPENNDIQIRRSFEPGHTRKILVIADESPEFAPALTFAAMRASRTGDVLKLLYVIEPPEESYWLTIKETHIEQRTRRGRAIFRDAKSRIRRQGLADVEFEECIRSGDLTDSIEDEITSDRDIAVIVLGAAHDEDGPGRIVSHLTAGTNAAEYLVPIVIVPGNLTADQIRALA